MPFPTIIPDAETFAVGARKFLDYVTPHLAPPQPPPLNPLPDPGAPAMPEAPPPLAAPPVPSAPGGFDPGAAMQSPPAPPPAPMPPPDPGPAPTPMPRGGFDPGAAPDPSAQADQFAQYVGSHPAMQAQQQAPPPAPAPPSAPADGGFSPAATPTDDAQRFADYTRRTAGVDPLASGPEGDRPQSEFAPPSQPPPQQQPFRPFPTPADASDYATPIEAGQPNAFNRLSVPGQLEAPAVPDPTEGPFAPDPVGRASTAVEQNVGAVGGQVDEMQALTTREIRAAQGGPPLTPEEQQRQGELQSTIGLMLTGEPIARVGGEVAGAVGRGLASRFSRLVSDAEATWLTDSVVTHIDDPRPVDGFNDPYLPGRKAVLQQHLAEVLPEGATLYHETSVPAARAIIQRAEQGPRSASVFTSDNPDLALGQGGRGVTLEFDPTLVNGAKSTNPAKALTDLAGQGAEYSISKTLRGAIQGIVVQSQRQLAQLAKDPVVARRFDVDNPEVVEGGLRIGRRVDAPPGQGIGLAGVDLLAGLGRPGLANLAGGAAGGAAGYASSPDTDTTQQRLERVGAGALLGATGVAAARGDLRGPVGRALGVTEGEAARAEGTAAGEVARLRLDKFPEAVRDTIQAAATDANFWRTQRRGVIPDAQAETMADDLGRTVDQVIARGKAGTAYTTEETRAIRNAVVAQSVKVNEIGQQIAQDPMGAGKGLVAEQVAEGLKLADLTRVAEGARAEAGRTLRAYQSFARDYAADPTSAVQRIFRSTNLTPEQATQKVTEFQKMLDAGADPFQMARFWANVEKPPPGILDWFSLLRYNAMLSGPRTLEVNTLGNAVEIPWRLLRDTGASVAKGQPRQVQAELAGTYEGFRQGMRAFGETLVHGITAEQAARGEVPRSVSARTQNPVGRVAATALEGPMRIMGATDELFRQTAYGMALGRQAALKATEEGLSGRAMVARADELFRTPSAGMMTAASSVADRMTYHGQMGPLGRALEGVQHLPVAGNLLLPFVRTVVHLTNRGLDLTPAGGLRTGFDVLRGGYRNGAVPPGMAPLGERVPDNVAGALGFGLLGILAGQGRLSGAGPQDPARRDTLRATGWRPYSVKIGDQWVSYSAWGPFAIPLSMAAAPYEAQLYAGPHATGSQMVMDGFRRGAGILADQGMLAGVGAIYKGVNEPDRYGGRWVEQFLQSLVPYGGLANTVGQAMDPYERQPRRGDLVGAVETRFPGVRESLPPAQDALGRPVPNEAQGLGALVPSRTSTDRPDPVLGALLDAGVAIPEPPPSVLGVPLAEEDKRLYREAAGRELQRTAQPLIAAPGWERRSPQNRADTLHALIDAARKTAANEAWKSATRHGAVKPRPAPPRPLR